MHPSLPLSACLPARLSPAAPGGSVLLVAAAVAVLPDVEVVLPGDLLLLPKGLDRLARLGKAALPLHAREAVPHHLNRHVVVRGRVRHAHPQHRLRLPAARQRLADPLLHRRAQGLASAHQLLQELGRLVPIVLLQPRGLHVRQPARERQRRARLHPHGEDAQVLGRALRPVAEIQVEDRVHLAGRVVRLHACPVHLAVTRVATEHHLPRTEAAGVVAAVAAAEGQRADLLQQRSRLVVRPLRVEEAAAHHVHRAHLEGLHLPHLLSRVSTSLRGRGGGQVLGGGLLPVLPQANALRLGAVLRRHQRGPRGHPVPADLGQASRGETLGKVHSLPVVGLLGQVQAPREGARAVDVEDLDLHVPLRAVQARVLERLVREGVPPPRAPHFAQGKGHAQRVLGDAHAEAVAREHVVHDGVHAVAALQKGQELLGLGQRAVGAEVVDAARGGRGLPRVQALARLLRLGLRLHQVLVARARVVVRPVLHRRRQAPRQQQARQVLLAQQHRRKAQRPRLLLLLPFAATLLRGGASDGHLPGVVHLHGHLLSDGLLPEHLLGLLGPGVPLVVVGARGQARRPDAAQLHPPLAPLLLHPHHQSVAAHHLRHDRLEHPADTVRVEPFARRGGHVVVPHPGLLRLGALLRLPQPARRHRRQHPRAPIRDPRQALLQQPLRHIHNNPTHLPLNRAVEVAELVLPLELDLHVLVQDEVLHKDLGPHCEGLHDARGVALAHQRAAHPGQEHRRQAAAHGLCILLLLLGPHPRATVRVRDQGVCCCWGVRDGDAEDVRVADGLDHGGHPGHVARLPGLHEVLRALLPAVAAHLHDLALPGQARLPNRDEAGGGRGGGGLLLGAPAPPLLLAGGGAVGAGVLGAFAAAAEGPQALAALLRALLRLPERILIAVATLAAKALGAREPGAHLRQRRVLRVVHEERAELERRPPFLLLHAVDLEHAGLPHQLPPQRLAGRPRVRLVLRLAVAPPQPRGCDARQEEPLLRPKVPLAGRDLRVARAPAAHHSHLVPAVHLLHHPAQPTRRSRHPISLSLFPNFG
mmetsp:Transcript_2149/g.4876  ORF Transcript_2149/g.4876 Transcript_2149/m.4876 type:complete len:1043 (-) Transcript_2149:91-3219(-)